MNAITSQVIPASKSLALPISGVTPELYCEIFDKLNLDEQHKASTVCRHWRRIIFDSAFRNLQSLKIAFASQEGTRLFARECLVILEDPERTKSIMKPLLRRLATRSTQEIVDFAQIFIKTWVPDPDKQPLSKAGRRWIRRLVNNPDCPNAFRLHCTFLTVEGSHLTNMHRLVAKVPPLAKGILSSPDASFRTTEVSTEVLSKVIVSRRNEFETGEIVAHNEQGHSPSGASIYYGCIQKSMIDQHGIKAYYVSHYHDQGKWIGGVWRTSEMLGKLPKNVFGLLPPSVLKSVLKSA